MGFSEELKLEVKQKAAFQCCRCRAISVEIHHIIPESEGGPDVIDNAAPLCPSCHALLGDNPKKRKEIREMRDWWYDVCQRTFSNPGPLSVALLAKINYELEQISAGREDYVPELQTTLSSLTPMNVSSITAGTAVISASGIVNTVSAFQLHPFYYGRKICSKCGNESITDQNTHCCPICGEPI